MGAVDSVESDVQPNSLTVLSLDMALACPLSSTCDCAECCSTCNTNECCVLFLCEKRARRRHSCRGVTGECASPPAHSSVTAATTVLIGPTSSTAEKVSQPAVSTRVATTTATAKAATAAAAVLVKF